MVPTADREKLEVSVQELKRRQVKKGGARVKKNGFNLIN
jgi:hypothetical protein